MKPSGSTLPPISVNKVSFKKLCKHRPHKIHSLYAFVLFFVSQNRIGRLDFWNCTELFYRMGSILPFIRPNDGSFDDEATRVMGEAFDAACKALHSSGQPQIVYDTIAGRTAHKGERDPVCLRNAGLAGLGYESKTG